MDYRGILIDSHITEYKKVFLSKLSPKYYVDMLVLAKVSSAMIYASCHNGNCYYPTKIGHQHKNLKGKDILGEIIKLCNKRNIEVAIYYSLIYNNWAYKTYPDWRIIKSNGKPAGEKCRYKVVCPNSPYREFVAKQIEEICSDYNFKRVFFDMTFWPTICYCKYCRDRFRKETGKEIPKVINWEDKDWVLFQRKREEWMREFAAFCTSKVKEFKPTVGVTHQFSTSLHDWHFGVPFEMANYCDYTSGDFYGDSARHSLACKVLRSLGKESKFEFFISRCETLQDHTTTKPFDFIKAQVFQVISHGGRVLFLDAINPDGTLEKSIFKLTGKIFSEVKKYEDNLGGEILADIGVYFSSESKISLEDNGKEVDKKFSSNFPHISAVINICRTFMQEHLPFYIVTKKDIYNLNRFKLIVLPEVLFMDEEEKKAIEEYVKCGGTIYASKNTSLYHKIEGKKGDFMLNEVFGLSYLGETKEKVTYISPKDKKVSKEKDIVIFDSQIKTKRKSGKILAYMTLPYFVPDDPEKFASIHSNPPGIRTKLPAVNLNKYGKGLACYVSANLEALDKDVHKQAFVNLVRILCKNRFIFEVKAPKQVEIIVFKESTKKCYLVNLVNFQDEITNFLTTNIRVKLSLEENEQPKRLIVLPKGKVVEFEYKNGKVEFNIPEIKTFAMYRLEYR